jgi:acyl-CoA thioesterase FadM
MISSKRSARPVVELHIDYITPVSRGRVCDQGVAIWTEGSRLNTEYQLIKQNGKIASSAYMVQLFTNHQTGEAYAVSPELLEQCRIRWKAGEFHQRP